MRATIHLTRMLVATLGLLGAQSALAQPERAEVPVGFEVEEQPREARRVDERVAGDARGRPCRTDRLIIDYVGEQRQDMDLEGWSRRSADRLQRAPDICTWFGVPAGECRVVARRIVDQETANRARVPELSGRHMELTFVDRAGRTLSLGENAICDAVGSLRWMLEETFGERARRDFHVSRACDASVLGDWATEATHQAAPPVAAGRQNGVVAIIDGPHTREGDAVVRPRAGVGDGPVSASSLGYAHADAVGLLVRRAAPRAEIRYYTALDGSAMGSPIGHVANAIARAAADAAGAPLVINLSLGWPRQTQRDAPVAGPTPNVLSHFTRRRMAACRDNESPAGSAVSAWMNALGDRGITFVAAAGNRRAAPGTPLGNPTKAAAMFYPAGWTGQMPHLIAVGAYGRRPVPELGVGAGPNNRPDLYAPGLRVPTLRPASLSSVVPVLLTGTSGATALVSGALANSPFPDRLRWLKGRLSTCPVNALPGTRAQFLGPCPDGDLVSPPSKLTRQPRRIRPRTRTPLRPGRLVPGPRRAAPRPGNGARIAIDRYAAGSVGPQPEDDGCLVPCRFLVDASALKGDLAATIEFGAPSTVKNPRLVFRSGSEEQTVFLPLSSVPSSPISTLKLDQKEIALPPPIKVDKTLEASFEFELVPTSGKTVRREVMLQVVAPQP